MSLDSETINEIAIELGVDPSFIEKDWYAVKVVQAIANFNHEGIVSVFSGGTSLSKGYGLLKRFSEDLDFRARFDSRMSPNKTSRRLFRNGIFNAVKSVEGITLNEQRMEAGSNYFKIPLAYPKQFDIIGVLRPTLQLEFSYTQPRRKSQARSVSSFMAEFTEANPETEILCLSPVETAADKLSALIWRVLKRDRGNENDDPAMIRHLHDLSALEGVIQHEAGAFVETANSAFDEDMEASRRRLGKNLFEAGNAALNSLRGSVEYEQEYDQFVAGMSYADEAEIIRFDEALDYFERLIFLFRA